MTAALDPAALARAEAIVAAEPELSPADYEAARNAGPALLIALRLALPAMQVQLAALLEIGCDQRGGEPIRSTLERALAPEVAQLETAVTAAEAALAEASGTGREGGRRDDA
jgi:hypothetical protein